MPSIGLTTVAQVRGYLVGIGEVVPPEHDDLLTFLVRAQSEAVALFCRRQFRRATRTEQHTGYAGERHLYPYQWPILSTPAPTITLDGITLTAGTADDQYRLVAGSDGESIAFYRPVGWESKPYGITVTYTAGYVLPGDDDPPTVERTLPYDLERAVVELAAGAYLQRGKAGLTRESFEGLSVDFDRWPLHIVNTLKKHRRPVF